MHHIEDALASVLDDMKQLDFSTSNIQNANQNQQQSNTPLVHNTVNSSLNVNNKVLTNLVASLPSSQTPSSSSSSSTSSSTSSTNDKNQNNLNCVKSDFSENLSQSSDDELRVKQRKCSGNESSAVIIGSPLTAKSIQGLAKRPDLVLDLPGNLLSSPSKQQVGYKAIDQRCIPVRYFYYKYRISSKISKLSKTINLELFLDS